MNSVYVETINLKSNIRFPLLGSLQSKINQIQRIILIKLCMYEKPNNYYSCNKKTVVHT